MLIEIEKMVDLDQINPSEIIGEPWSIFGDSIPKEQYNILTRVLKLLFATNDTMTDVVPLILDTLGNETFSIQAMKLEIYSTLNNVLVDLVEEMGVHLHEESNGYNNLHVTRYIIETLLEVGSMEDAYGLADKLLDESVDSVERFMSLVAVIFHEEVYGDLEHMIHSVDELLFRVIAGTFKHDDVLVEGLSPELIKRVRANPVFMDNTLGRQVVSNSSALEGNINTFKTFYANELEALFDDGSPEGIKAYVINLASLYLVSSTNTRVLREVIEEDLRDFSENILMSVAVDELLNQLVLSA